ncbi:hypothetical protein M0R45_004154 [Rubus argutus]|uniref:Uncharacterized protein n=1 Tax=Rubus argutus TaxID=59490 RepID=A0AAW1YIY0_RUBAR
MADFRYQWQQYLVFLHERDNIVIFNIVLVDFARQAAPSTFAIFTFMVPILVTCIQIKFSYAGTSSISSPFETHHTIFMVAMLSLLAYCCFAIAATQNYFPTHAPKLRLAIKFTASLSVASLVSLLLPKPWDHVPYMIYVLYFIGHCLGLVRNICLAYFQEHVANRFVRSLRARQQQSRRTLSLLPVTLSGRNISNQPIANHGSITQVRTLH